MWEQIKQVNADTWARTICFALALVNQILAIFGKDQISFVESEIYQVVSIIFTIITGVAAWWKNNSFTAAARKGDLVMSAEKLGVDLSADEDTSEGEG